MVRPFRIYDTLRRSIVPFVPRRPGHVGLYVCGMTVYDHAHVGHARAMVVFDAFVRYLRHGGWDVHYVRNYTGIDDAFDEDMRALGLLAPDAAMAHDTLEGGLDIHGGGLVFPHHENEIAQSECAHGAPHAGHWMHSGLLTTSDGAEIARSEGDGATIREVLTQTPSEALRLAYLSAHYRAPLAWSDTTVRDALSQLARLYAAIESARAMGGDGDADRMAHELGRDAADMLARARALPACVEEALDDDFDTPRALQHVFELARAIQRVAKSPRIARSAGPIADIAIASLAVVRDTLGLLGSTPEAFDAEVRQKLLPVMGLDAASIDQRVARRIEARARRAFDEADAIRAELDAMGLDVRDTPRGTDWRVRV